MRRTTLALIFTLTLALTVSPVSADDGSVLARWAPIDVWTWFLDLTGFSKIGGATSDPDGTPAPPPTEEGSTPADPGGDDSVTQGPANPASFDTDRGDVRRAQRGLARWHL